MSDPEITHEFVRALTHGIREAYGKEVSHLAIMDLIAEASGRKTDALMHKLKAGNRNYRINVKASEAPDSMPAETISRWVENRKWRNIAKTAAFLISKRGTKEVSEVEEDVGVDWPVVTACGALGLIFLEDATGALTLLAGHHSDDARVMLVNAYAALAAGKANDPDKIVRCLAANPQIMQIPLPHHDGHIKSIFGDLNGGPFVELVEALKTSGNVKRHPESDQTTEELIEMLVDDEVSFAYHDWSETLDYLLSNFPSSRLNIAIIRNAMEAGVDIKLKPAVPVNESLDGDIQTCLFTGIRSNDLVSIIKDLGLTPDQYRRIWRLPSDYPTLSVGPV